MPNAAPDRPAPYAPPPPEARGYARADVLVATAWLAARLGDPDPRVLESDDDVLLDDTGHVPGAQTLDWHADLNDPLARDFVDRAGLQALLRRLGVDESTTVVLYGDKNNWWATYAFWVFRLFGCPAERLRVVDGGRTAGEREGRPLVDDRPSYPATAYLAPERDGDGVGGAARRAAACAAGAAGAAGAITLRDTSPHAVSVAARLALIAAMAGRSSPLSRRGTGSPAAW